MRRILEALGLSFISQHYIKTRFREWPFIVDYYIPPDLVIEVDGVYWHRKKTRRRKDAVKDECLKAEGYTVYRFTDEELAKDPDLVKRLIQNRLEVKYAKAYIPEDT